MITANDTSNRSREGALVTNVAHCDAGSCKRTIALRPRTEEEASILSTNMVPAGWVRTFLESRSWSVEGVKTYCRDHAITGISEEEEIILLDDEIEDQIRRFLDEKTDPAPEGRTVYADLMKAYKQWAGEKETIPVGKRKFGEALRKDGLSMKTVSLREGEPGRGPKKVRSFYCVMGVLLRDQEWSNAEETKRAKHARLKKEKELLDIEIARLRIENLELREALLRFLPDLDPALAPETTRTTKKENQNR